MRAAVPAHDLAAQRITHRRRLAYVDHLPALGKDRLRALKGLAVDDGGVRVFGIILIQLTRIAPLFLGQMIFHKGLLQQGIARILLVGQHFDHMVARPRSSEAPRCIGLPKPCRDTAAAGAIQICSEHVPHHGGFVLVDHDLSVHRPVAIQQHQVHGLPLGEILAYPPFAVVGHAFALLLRKRSEDGEHQLAVPAHGVDVLLLKINVNAQRLQLAHRFEHGHRVAGEPADGLGEDQVDLSRPAIREHLPESGPVALCAGVRFIGVHARVFPAGLALDIGAVVADLPGEGMQHGVLSRGDAAIGRHTLAARGGRVGFDLPDLHRLLLLFFLQGAYLLPRPYIPLLRPGVNRDFDTNRPRQGRIFPRETVII